VIRGRFAYPDYRAALLPVLQRNVDAIEHALHQGRLVDLGLRTDTQVREQIGVSLAEAGIGRFAMAALAAADYDDNPPAFARRRQAALWRACQLHGCEDEYWRLVGRSPYAAPAPLIPPLGQDEAEAEADVFPGGAL
jgi:hypothetical protein